MIIAIHKTTKEHRFVPEFEVCPNPDWRYVAADDDGWIPWNGRECPVPDGSIVDIRYRYPEGKELHLLCADEYTDWREAVAYRPTIDFDTGPEPPTWDGECPPPVGWRGEYKPYWHACEVVAYHKGFAVIWDSHDLEYFRTRDASIFRHIRSEEDRAVEEIERHITIVDSAETVARCIYRSIRDGKIPGVMLE